MAAMISCRVSCSLLTRAAHLPESQRRHRIPISPLPLLPIDPVSSACPSVQRASVRCPSIHDVVPHCFANLREAGPPGRLHDSPPAQHKLAAIHSIESSTFIEGILPARQRGQQSSPFFQQQEHRRRED